MPIAVFFAGDFICLDFKDNSSKPCIWYHNESREFSPLTRKVADSFEEFLEMLKE